jgi:3-hydroxyisobutyrate dehydrogenase
MEVGYVLCGGLGAAEAQILARTYPVRLWDRSRHSPATLAEGGMATVTNGATLARACDVIFVRLPHSSDVRAAMSGTDGLMGGLSRGNIVVDRTPGGPDQTRAMASELSAVGAALIDAPASGVWDPGDASAPGIVLSGSLDACDTVRPLLEKISPHLYYCGQAGNSQVLDLMIKTMSACTQLATLEIAAMGRKFGLGTETMAEVISKGSGRNRTSQILLPAIAAGTAVVSNFPMPEMLEALTLSTGMGASCGVPMFTAHIARGLLQAGVHRFGEHAVMDDAIELIGGMANTELRG